MTKKEKIQLKELALNIGIKNWLKIDRDDPEYALAAQEYIDKHKVGLENLAAHMINIDVDITILEDLVAEHGKHVKCLLETT